MRRLTTFLLLWGRFVVRVCAPLTAVDCRPDRGESFPAADTAFASLAVVSSVGGAGSAEGPDAATDVAQHAHSVTSTILSEIVRSVQVFTLIS